MLAVDLPRHTTKWMNQQKISVVQFSGKGPVSVNIDGVDVVKMGVETLVARGCRRLALWSETWSEPNGRQEGTRSEARVFRRALATHGLEFQENWLRPQARAATGRSSYELACDWVSQSFKAPRADWPDGLIINNDILARDVMLALQRLDIVPNRDIIIASHANSGSPILRGYEDDLTLIEFDSGEIVQAMFDQLETLGRGESPEQEHIRIEPRIRRGAGD